MGKSRSTPFQKRYAKLVEEEVNLREAYRRAAQMQRSKPVGEHRIIKPSMPDLELAPGEAFEFCAVEFDENGRVSDVTFVCRECIGKVNLCVYLNGSKVSEFQYLTGKVKLPLGSVAVKAGDEVVVMAETTDGAEVLGCGASYTFWADQ